jgi:hypothetical protein
MNLRRVTGSMAGRYQAPLNPLSGYGNGIIQCNFVNKSVA